MKKTICCFILFYLSATYSFINGQRGNNWYFGLHAGVTFNTDPPSALSNGMLNTNEGCATISDSTGQLSFYTDGIFVFNRNHQLMPNGIGLMGHPSSTQSSMVIRKPGSDSLYYIFTVDAAENQYSNGYRYSIVDMSLDGGLGDVTDKNVLMYAPSTEKITAVLHANGIDVWIVTKEHTGDAYRAYKLTCDGLEMNPVISHGGVPYGPSSTIRVGALKTSPDGTKIASARYTLYWELFQFNNLTGQLSNPLRIPTRHNAVFGLEFSPNSKLIYNSTECCGLRSTVTQYKVDVYDSAAIVNSYYLVDSSAPPKGDMQLGPNGKIYGPNRADSSLFAINNPDQYGAACSFINKAINLGQGRLARRCLPSFFKDNITNSNVDFDYTVSATNCNEVTFTGTTSLAPPVNWFWDFGDGNTGTGQTVTHIYSNAASVTVKLTATKTGVCGARAIKSVTLDYNAHKPVAKFGYISECGNQSVLFKDSSSIVAGNINSWEWDLGDGNTSTSQNPQHTYSAFGQYNVRLIVTANGFCPKRDTIFRTVEIKVTPQVSFTYDQTCVGKPVQFSASSSVPSNDIMQWIWDFGDSQTSLLQNPQHSYSAGNTYLVKFVVRHINGCLSDTFKTSIQMGAKPVAAFSFDAGCAGDQINFTDQSTVPSGSITSWYWDFGNGNFGSALTGTSVYTNAGQYTIRHAALSNGNCSSDTVEQTLTIEDKPSASFNFTKDCGSPTVSFTDNSNINFGNIISWNWNFGDGNTTTIQHPAHTYTTYQDFSVSLTVKTANGCTAPVYSETIRVNNLYVFAGNDTVAYKGQPLQLAAAGTGIFTWSPVIGLNNSSIANPVATLQNDQTYILRLTANDGCIKYDTINIKVYERPEIYVPGGFTPNADGKNDFLGPICFGIKKLHYFSVYNRWGQLVFTTKDINGRWDGLLQGTKQNTATFVWMVQGESYDGRIITRKGTSTLIR